MPSLTVENYVKAIYQVRQRQHGEPAATGQLATVLGLSPGAVTSMLKTLRAAGLATYAPYEGVRLTEAGDALALRVLRRHRLIELFLNKTLELSWDEVHEEAENMEHAVSDRLIDRIEAMLGYPDVDPHGDPIPRRDGSLDHPTGRTLAELPIGQKFRLARVLDQTPEFLRFLRDRGLTLGSEGVLTAHLPEAGTLTVQMGAGETTLGLEAAQWLQVLEA